MSYPPNRNIGYPSADGDINYLTKIYNTLPQEPLLLQVPQLYRNSVRRPHWQQPQYIPQQPHYIPQPQYIPQQVYQQVQPPQFSSQQHEYQNDSIPQSAQSLPILPSSPSPQPSQPPQVTYQSQDEGQSDPESPIQEEEEEEEQSNTDNGKKKRSSKLRRRKSKPQANQVSLPQDVLGMQVKTAAQLGKYVSRVLDALSLHQTGMYLSVKNMNYYVQTKETARKHVLKDVSFYLKPGMMCLVLGAPGGGRSSLFKVLANVTPKKSSVEGQVLFNNKPIDPNTHHRRDITQNDNHMPTLTVRETLYFSSECILPPNLSSEAKEQRLNILLNILGLQGCQDTLVGNEFVRGISGGQKKRVTIGLDLMKGGNIYFMDEPTTGLDSVTSLEVLSCVKALALSTHVGVLCALLQPPKEVYDLFDYVMLVNGGEISYFGTTKDAIPYFEELGLRKPETMNPAEFLQEVVVTPDDFSVDPESNELKTPEQFAALWKNSPQYEEIMKVVSDPNELIPEEQQQANPNLEADKTKTYAIPMWKQVQLCMWRSYKMTTRNYISIFSRTFQLVLVAIILGTLFVNLGKNQASVSSYEAPTAWLRQGVIHLIIQIPQRSGLVYFSFLTILFSSFVTIRDLYDQRPIFYEQRDQRKWYTTFPYFISYITPELVIGMFCVILFTVTLYFLVDLNLGDVRFLYFLLNLFLTELFGASFLIAMSALTSSSLYASVIVPSVLMLFILASGFTIPGNQIPGWWIWLYWASPVRWCFEGLLINEFSGQSYHCSSGEALPHPGDLPGFTGTPVCPITSGVEVIALQGFNTNFWWRWIDLSVLAGFCVLCFAAAFIAMKFIILPPKGAPIAKQNAKDKKKNKSEAVVEMGQKQLETNQLRIYGCTLVFKHLNYFVKVQRKKPAEAPQGERKVETEDVDAQGNKFSANSSDYKKELPKADEAHLLKDVSGCAKPGCLLALMGPSGAGKSTLLDVLANRKNSGRITGQILIDGKERDKYFTRYSAYVTQTDVLFPTSTVREAITFSAMCRLPDKIPVEEKLEFVDSILNELRLTNIANDVIGTLGSGLTLEQRKRVNIAVELAANPQMLFLDEPTSGLDSAGARKVMKYVKRLSRQGRTIVCTIHQPSSEIFKMFDQLLLLSQHGEVVYFGDIGEEGNDFLRYCEQFGYQMEKERNAADFALEFSTATNRVAQILANPEDHVMEAKRLAESSGRIQRVDGDGDTDLTLSPDTPAVQQWPATPLSPLSHASSPRSPHLTRSPFVRRSPRLSQSPHNSPRRNAPRYEESVEGLVQGYQNSDQYRIMESEADELERIEQPKEFYDGLRQEGTYASTFWTQMRENVRRSMVSAIMRRRAELIFIVCQNLFLGTFLGTIFITIGLDQDGVRNRVSLIFFSTNFAGFIGFSQIAPVAAERAVFYHEQASGTYRPVTYGVALICSSLPAAMLSVLAYSIPAYWIPDLEPRHDWHRFLFFIFVYFITSLVFIAMSVSLAVALPNEGIAVMVLGIVIPVFTLFGGFLIPRTQIPGWWIWAYWGSAIHYPVEAMTLNTINGLHYHCDSGQFVPLINGDGTEIHFDQYGLLPNWKWIDVGVLCGSYSLFVALTLIALSKIRWEKT